MKYKEKMSEEKIDLCRKFVTDPGDDLFHLVETLVDLRDEECQCVYPSSKVCNRVSACPFGFCSLHVRTKKGADLATLWNNTLEELEISESSDIEDEEPVDEEDDIQEEVIITATRNKPVTPKRTTPKIEVKTPPKTLGKTPVKKVEKKPKKKEHHSEESSVAEGSAKTEYVPPVEDDEEPVREELKFKRSKHGNLVNEEHGFVIRPTDRTILGIENPKGGIKKLTAEQKKFCRENQLNFIE